MIERGNISLAQDLKLILKLIIILRKENPDILHNISLKPVLYGSIAGIFSNIPKIINTFPGLGFLKNDSTDKFKIFIRFLLKKLLSLVLNIRENTVIVQNTDDYSYCKKQLSLKKNGLILIRGSGVNVKKFVPKKEPDGYIRVSLVSRMLYDKGINEFVESAKILKSKYPNVIFSLIGLPDKENNNSVSKEILKNWHNQKIIEWLGYNKDINKIWGISHIACLPTFYSEGLPKSLLEASSCGRPIISSDNPGCREIVEDKYNGLIVPEKNVLKLVEAIEYMINHKNERIRMGQNGRKKVVSMFDRKIINKKTLKTYH